MEKELSLDQVGMDTNISVRYLQALEAEDFSDFPGETYITGFLRNYGAYLDLDVNEILSLYRALKIQEQPVPMEQLLKPRSNLPKIFIILAVVIAILGAGGGAYYFLTRPREKEAAGPVARAAAEHVMDGNSLERRIFTGDSVLVQAAAGQYRLELVNLGEAVTIRTPASQVILDLSQEANVDMNGDGLANLRITVIDFVKNNPGMGVLLHFGITEPAAGSFVQEAAQDPAETVNTTVFTGSSVIFSSPNPYPFTLQTSFQGYCMFRWEILFERDRRDRNERHFQRSDVLDIQAQNGIRIWTSNAQAAKFQVIGGGRTVPLEIGAAGEVVVTDIRWVRNEDNRYSLVLARLETGS